MLPFSRSKSWYADMGKAIAGRRNEGNGLRRLNLRSAAKALQERADPISDDCVAQLEVPHSVRPERNSDHMRLIAI